MSIFLDRDSFLEGQRAAVLRARPLRMAFLLNQRSLDAVERVIEFNTFLWGGFFNLLVPIDADGTVDADWREILKSHDPDRVIDCTGSPTRLGPYLDRLTTAWGNANAAFPGVPCPVYFALAHAARAAPNDFVYEPIIEKDDPMYLSVLASYGKIPRGDYSTLLHALGYASGLQYDALMPVHKAYWADVRSILFGHPPSPRSLPGGLSRGVTALGMTQTFLPRLFPPYIFGDGEIPERPQFDESYIDQVLVTGQGQCVGDLCLAWAVQQQRPANQVLPRLVPIEALKSPDGVALLQSEAKAGPPRDFLPPSKRALAILSTSASQEQIEALVREAGLQVGVEVEVHTKDFHRFYSSKFRAGIEEEVILSFERGKTRYRLPTIDILEEMGGTEQLALDVEIDSFLAPATGEVTKHMALRASRTGMVTNFIPSQRKQLVPLSLPSKWDCVEAIFRSAGLVGKPSDKGRQALALVRLLGGPENLRILASSRVFQMLEATRNLEPFQLSQAKDLLQSPHTERFLEWSLRRGLIARGTSIKCPRCDLTSWYAFESLTNPFRCDGCFESMPLPLKVDATQWKYRVNELVRKAFRQGIFPHLLLFLASWNPWPFKSEPQSLGFFPGIELHAQDSPVKEVGKGLEIDYAEIFDGRLIVGECKVNGNAITDDDASRYMKLGALLACSRVVFFSMTPFLEETKRRLSHFGADFPLLVQFMEYADVVDRTWSQQLSMTKPEGADVPAQYLDYLAAQYFSGI